MNFCLQKVNNIPRYTYKRPHFDKKKNNPLKVINCPKTGLYGHLAIATYIFQIYVAFNLLEHNLQNLRVFWLEHKKKKN